MIEERDELGQILQACLAEIQAGRQTVDTVLQRYPEYSEELRPQLEAAVWLMSCQPVFDPRPGFLAASRRRLISSIHREALSASSKPWWAKIIPENKSKLALRLALAFLLVLSFLFAGNKAAYAAQIAMPGDTAYPLKIALENIELALTFNDARSAELHIEFAQTRLREINNLALQNKYDLISSVVINYDQQVTNSIRVLDRLNEKDSAHAKKLAEQFRSDLDDQAGILNILVEEAPEQAQPGLQQAIQVSQIGIYAAQGILSNPHTDQGSPGDQQDQIGMPPTQHPGNSDKNNPGNNDKNNKVDKGPSSKTDNVSATNTPRPTHTPKPDNKSPDNDNDNNKPQKEPSSLNSKP